MTTATIRDKTSDDMSAKGWLTAVPDTAECRADGADRQTPQHTHIAFRKLVPNTFSLLAPFCA